MSLFMPGCVREPRRPGGHKHRRTGGHKHSNKARQVDGVLGALGAAALVPPEAAAGLVAPEPPVPPLSVLGVADEPESALVAVVLAAGDFFAPPESVL
jgi:hypothetical protein